MHFLNQLERKKEKYTPLLIYAIVTILWVGVIFSFSLQTGDESSELSGGIVDMIVNFLFPNGFAYMDLLEFLIRKCAHFTEYFILGVLVLQTLKQTRCPRKVLVCALFCICVASCDESIQLFTGGRSGQITDVMLDSTGAVCGCVTNWLLSKCRKQKRH